MEMLDYEFMKNALLAIVIMTPLFGLLGTMIVNNKMAFFSDALGHSAFTGIALGMLLRDIEQRGFYDFICSCFCFIIK